MKDKAFITDLLRRSIVILDGAMGTELDKRGLPPGACPEAWSAGNPDAVLAVHAGYLAAGADVIYTATLGGNPWKLGHYGETDTIGLNRALARLARQAAGDKARVAGDISSSGKFMEPYGDLGFREAVEGFKLQAKGLAEGGVDLFAIETMFDLEEARAALTAVKETSPDAFAIVTLTFQSNGRTLAGNDPASVVAALQDLGADAAGVNCGAGPAEALPLIRAMRPAAGVPLVAKPNAGMPRWEAGRTVFAMGPEEFAGFAKAFAEAGANLLGGCCGTTPEHIRLLKNQTKGLSPAR